jgi:hypothetical protein
MTEMTTRTDAFQDVMAGWGEAIACQSVHGCSRQAKWVAVAHKPCGGPQSICAEHVLRWMGGGDGNHCRAGRNALPGW